MSNEKAKIDQIREMGKIGVDYERQLAIVGKEKADNVLYFWMKGYTEAELQLQSRIKELEDALKGIEAICDNTNPSHESIWRIAYSLLNNPTPWQTILKK